MKSMSLAPLAALALLACAGAAHLARAHAAPKRRPLTLLGRTSFPGYDGDVDHLYADIPANKLFVAAEDHGTVEVFNLTTGAHLATLTGFNTPHAFFRVPGTHRLIITDGGKRGSRIIDDRTYRVLGYIRLQPGADTGYYDPSTRRFYIVTGGSDVHLKHCWLNEIDPWTGRLLRRLEFDSAHVEALRAEQHGERIFINIADRNQVDVISKRTFRVIARWPIDGPRTNLTMSLDEAHRRLFVVTRNPSRLVVLDTRTGKTVATLPVPAIVDGSAFDVQRQRLYIPGAVGTIGVYQELDPDHYREIAQVRSAKGAKSEVFVPRLNELFVGVSPQYSQPHLAGVLRYRVR